MIVILYTLHGNRYKKIMSSLVTNNTGKFSHKNVEICYVCCFLQVDCKLHVDTCT
jgi:hypothetical protein